MKRLHVLSLVALLVLFVSVGAGQTPAGGDRLTADVFDLAVELARDVLGKVQRVHALEGRGMRGEGSRRACASNSRPRCPDTSCTNIDSIWRASSRIGSRGFQNATQSCNGSV